jgi:hypothetical protein
MAVNFALFITHQFQVLSDLSSEGVLPNHAHKGAGTGPAEE